MLKLIFTFLAHCVWCRNGSNSLSPWTCKWECSLIKPSSSCVLTGLSVSLISLFKRIIIPFLCCIWNWYRGFSCPYWHPCCRCCCWCSTLSRTLVCFYQSPEPLFQAWSNANWRSVSDTLNTPPSLLLSSLHHHHKATKRLPASYLQDLSCPSPS